MSLLDVKHAKQALAWRLKEWSVDGDPVALAASFIDDLVEKGWRMDAVRELRAEIPKASEACPECNGFAGRCGCRVKKLIVERSEPDHPHALPDAPADASLARALLAQARGALCGCGVRIDTCPTHRTAATDEEPAMTAELGHVGHTIEEKS